MKTRLPVRLVAFAAVIGAATLQAQTSQEDRMDFAIIDSTTPVTVTMSRGSIEVVATSLQSVAWQLHGVRHDSSIAIAGPWNRALQYDGTLRLDVTPPADAGLGPLSLKLMVPRNTKLLHIRLTAGNITVTGFNGDLVIESDSGMVHGTQLGGGVVVETRDGGIDVAVSSASPKHPISLLARNGTITLGVPVTGLAPGQSEAGGRGAVFNLDVVPSCGLPDRSGRVVVVDSRDQTKAIEALGIHVGGSGCDWTPGRVENGVATNQIGQQVLEGTWLDGGAAISLRTLRGSIVLRRR